jgi:MFS family permease
VARVWQGSNRSIVALLSSLTASATSSMLLDTVLGKQVFDISGRELDLGILGLAAFAPSLILVLLTGSIADRYDRRRVAAAALAGEVVAAAGILAYVATEPTAVGPLFLLVFVFGICRAFASPATRALPADIVEPERLPWLVARYTATWQVAMVVGPVLGGFLYAADARLPYVAVIGLVGLSIVGVSLVQPNPRAVGRVEAVGELTAPIDPTITPQPPKARFSEAVEGVRFIRTQPMLLGAISLDLFAVLFGGAIALLPALCEEQLHVGAVGFGWLRAAGGIGAGLVTVALATRPLQRHLGRALFFVVALFGVATIVLGATHVYAVAFIAMLVLSGADSVSVFIRVTLVPLVTPPSKRGRVLAVENVFIGASNELGAFESGVAGQLLGPAGAIVLGGVATLGVATAWTALFPDLRDVDRFPAAVDSSA